MGIVSDFIGRVSDPLRGASPASTNSHVHGGGFQSPNPAVAAWLDSHPEVGEALTKTSTAVAALEGASEGALIAFDKARERFDEAKATESRAHYDAREHGKAIDPDVAKRLLRARQSALTANEDSAARAAIASNSFATTRDALNEALKFVGSLAAERSGVVLAPDVALPDGTLDDIIMAQRNTLADLDVEQAEIESAPIPVEHAVAMARASVGRVAPTIELSPQRVDWTPPQQRLNVAPQLGDGAVNIDDAVAMLAWLFPEVMADKLEAAIRAKYGAVKTYTSVERSNALASLKARRDTAERIEVAAIFAAWEQGTYIPLRKNTGSLNLLGIERVTEGAKDPEGYVGSAYLGQSAR